MARKRPSTDRDGRPHGAAGKPLAIAFSGDVFTVFFELNNQEVTLRSDGGNTLARTFTSFPSGPLQVLLHAKGLNGTAWTLTMKYGADTVLDEQGTITSGFSHLVRALVLR